MSAAARNAIKLAAESNLRPRVGLVLGSGLGIFAKSLHDTVTLPYADLEGFPGVGVSGHAGALTIGRAGGVPVAVLSGRVHFYEHGDAAVMRPVVETLAEAGVEELILTNAAGSLRAEVGPGEAVLVTDHINWSGTNPLIGEADERRFTPMHDAYDPQIRERLAAAARAEGITLHEGVYAWFSGPTFETPAEIGAARILGADLVGMSTVPEVILARFFGLRCAALSAVTNHAAGMAGAEISHEDTKRQAPRAGERIGRIITTYLREHHG